MSTVTLHIGDVHDRLADIPDGSVDLIVTSPPFLALRSYLPADHPDKAREIGSEATPADFLDTLLRLTAECRRVLAPDGSLCVELGDTYSGSGGAGGDYGDGGLRDGQPRFRQRTDGGMYSKDDEAHGWNRAFNSQPIRPISGGPGWPLAKSLTGIPTLYAWSLAYGRNLLTGAPSPAGQWRIRNLLVWARPNPPVGALGDKFRPACSYVTVACTGTRRWFDLDAVRTGQYAHPERIGKPINNGRGAEYAEGVRSAWNSVPNFHVEDRGGAPPLDWYDDIDDGPTGDRLWQMPTQPYKGAHYATYPLELPLRLIKAMCPAEVCRTCGKPRERITTPNYVRSATWRGTSHAKVTDANGVLIPRRNGWQQDGSLVRADETLGWSDCGHGDNYRPGIVLDPFLGSGTTAVAAALTGRDSIGIDLDARNAELVDRRLRETIHVVDMDALANQHRGRGIVWSCDAPLPDQRDQIEGQTTLLDLLEAP